MNRSMQFVAGSTTSGRFDIQLCAVGEKGIGVELCNLHDRFVLPARAFEHFVLTGIGIAGQVTHIGDVHHALHVVPLHTEGIFPAHLP